MNEDDLRKILSYDAISEAERKVKKDHPSFFDLCTMLLINNTEQKNHILKAADDTLFSESVNEYIRKVENIGFEIILCEKFFGIDGDSREERIFVMYRNPGIILKFDTYNLCVNSGDFYFNWERRDKTAGYTPPNCSGGWYGKDKSYIFSGHQDCREAIKFHIMDLENYGNFVEPWKYAPYMSFLHYQDWKDVERLSFQEQNNLVTSKNRSRYEKLPNFVKEKISIIEKEL